MIKFLTIIFFLSALSASTMATSQAPSKPVEIINDAISQMNGIIQICINEVQDKLNEIGKDTTRYVHTAEYSGDASQLVSNIDSKYKNFVQYVTGSVSNLYQHEFAILLSAENKLSAFIPDKQQAFEVRNALTATYNRTSISCKEEVEAYKSEVQRIMHNAAEKSAHDIQLARKDGSYVYGVPAADAAIFTGLTNSNKTLHNTLNIIGVLTQKGQKQYIQIAADSLTVRTSPTKIIKNVSADSNSLIGKFNVETQNALDSAAIDTNRYIREAEYTGNTKNLVQTIDKRYEQFGSFIDRTVPSLYAKKRAALKAAEAHLNAAIPDKNAAHDIFYRLDSTLNQTINASKVQIKAYITGIEKIMHNGAEQATEEIKEAVWRGSNIYGVPAADATIHWAQINANKTLHARLNVLAVDVQLEENHFLKIVDDSSADKPTLSKKDAIEVAKQVIQNTDNVMNTLATDCINEVQVALDKAGGDSNRYVSYADRTGHTSDLIPNIHKIYNRFADYADLSVSNQLANKYAVLQLAINNISSYIPNEKLVRDLRQQFNETFNHSMYVGLEQVNAYKTEISRTMHNAAIKSVKNIQEKFNSKQHAALSQANIAIHLGVVSANNTYHDHINLIAGIIQTEQKEYLNIVEKALSSPGFMKKMFHAANKKVVKPVTHFFKKAYKSITS